MKKLLVFVLMLCLLCACAQADVIPPYGMGQIGFQAVVLCQSLTVRSERSASARAVATLRCGDTFATMSDVDGWRDCFLSETGGRTGWIKADYVIIDPAWYTVERSTPAFAWNAGDAYRVGLLDAGTKYPILKTEGDWLLIGLRGAAAWVEDAAAAVAARSAAFAPGDLRDVERAEIMLPDGSVRVLTDPQKLRLLEESFASATERTAADCPFDAVLQLTMRDGHTAALDIATDGCCVFRVTDHFYTYGVPSASDSAENSRAFWALFGLTAEELYQR